MTVKHVFVLDTVIGGLFGFGLMAFPNELLSLFGIADPAAAAQALLARLLGTSLIGIGATEWFARNVAESGTLPIVRGMLWFDILAVIVSLQATLSRTVNAFGWLVVGLFLFFTVARISLSFKSIRA